MLKPQSHFRRVLSFTTSLSMAISWLPAAAQAQTAPTPPDRVGQITSLSGPVSFNSSGTQGWAQAAQNYPVAAGDSLYTQEGARATIALNASKIALNSNTELQITQLSDSLLAATAAQGELFLHVDELEPGQDLVIATPRGTVTISQDGEYDIQTGDANSPALIMALQGQAAVQTSNATLEVPQGQEAVLSGTDDVQAQLAPANPDDFARYQLARAAPPPPAYAPPAVAQMTGAYELSNYGNWSQDPQYGAVWYPNVAEGWAPYREGHWAFIAPWGWTWVDAEPWGFAPFHYGRWFGHDGRWGWAPAPAYREGYDDEGPNYQPVYAPAVVSFFGLAAGVAITAALLNSRSVGWVPLAPNEPFYPYYHASPNYIRRINVVNVTNINVVNIHQNNYYNNPPHDGFNHFANRRAATMLPGDAMSHGRSVATYGKPAPQTVLAAARPINPGYANARPAQGQASYNLPRAAGPLALQHPAPPPPRLNGPQPHGPQPHGPQPHGPQIGGPQLIGQQPHGNIPGNNLPHQAGQPGQPGQQPGQPFHPGQPERPAFISNNPGYHAPPAPPGAHNNMQAPAQNFHAPAPAPTPGTGIGTGPGPGQFNQPHPNPQPNPQFQRPPAQAPQFQQPRPQPQAQPYHPPQPPVYQPPVYHPQPQPRPQPQQFQQPQGQPRPQPQQFQQPQGQPRPQPQPQPQYHPQPQPQPQQFHPQEMPRPQPPPRPQAPPPPEQNKKDQHP